jgi:hypothetical protein
LAPLNKQVLMMKKPVRLSRPGNGMKISNVKSSWAALPVCLYAWCARNTKRSHTPLVLGA